MKYAAVHRLWLLEQPAATEGDCEAIGAWVLLSVFAADRELGEGDDDIGVARIKDCAGWSDRTWIASACLDCSDVAAAEAGGLAEWDDVDLLVLGYDMRGQRAAGVKRINGAKGGRPKKPTGYPTGKPNDNPVVPESETDRVTQAKPPSLPSLSSPNPPSPAGGFSRSEIAGQLYLEVSGNTDLPLMSCNWNHKHREACTRMATWGTDAGLRFGDFLKPEPDKFAEELRNELTALKQDNFIAGSPIHVWAARLGTGKNKKATGAAIVTGTTDYENADTVIR